MTKHATTRFFSRTHRDFARDDFADSTQPKLATFHVAFHLFAMFRSRAFGSDNHSSKVTGRFARIDHARNFSAIKRNFGNQNDVGAAGDTALQRDPSRMPSHHSATSHPPSARLRRRSAVLR